MSQLCLMHPIELQLLSIYSD